MMKKEDALNKGQQRQVEEILSTTESIFNIYEVENWIVMFPLAIILGIIMIWCFYFRFMKAVMARRRLIFVEVMDQSNSEFYISRFQAK